MHIESSTGDLPAGRIYCFETRNGSKQTWQGLLNVQGVVVKPAIATCQGLAFVHLQTNIILSILASAAYSAFFTRKRLMQTHLSCVVP